jgi:hypothetical protein
MKQMIGKLLAWFLPASTTEHKLVLVDLRLAGLEMENKQLTEDMNRLRVMFDLKNISDNEPQIHQCFDNKVSLSVMSWLKNWLDDYDVSESESFKDGVGSILDDHDFSDQIDDALGSRDWSYELEGVLDYDDLADKVLRKVDWSDIISDNDIVTTDDIDCSDVMLKSEQLSEDETIKRGELSEEISNDLKRDWFKSFIAEMVDSEFQHSLGKARENAQANSQNAIDDEIQNAVAERIESQFKTKFGEEWDNWFSENIRHTVQTVLGEMLQSAYEQTKSEGKSNA